jgi:hypothetical protein
VDRSDLMLAYAKAHGALERLDDRWATSPVAGAWRARMAWTERHALAWADSFDIPADALVFDKRGRLRSGDYDLTHCKDAIGAPISRRALLEEPEQLLAWLGGERAGAGPDSRWETIQAIETWSRASTALPPAPPLLMAARLSSLWRRHAPLGRGDVVASLLIGDRWSMGRQPGSQGGLVALGMRHNGGRWKTASGEEAEHLWLGAIRAGAMAHLELENRLRAFAMRVRHVLVRRRRSGQLGELMAFAMERPLINSSDVAQRTGLTHAGAIKLLSIAHDEGLLIETTGQASYRRYAIPLSEPQSATLVEQQRSQPMFAEPLGEVEAKNHPFQEPF